MRGCRISAQDLPFPLLDSIRQINTNTKTTQITTDIDILIFYIYQGMLLKIINI